MVIYIDSSFLLSIIFEEQNSNLSIEIWKNHDYRVSSILLESECLITLRRFFKNNEDNLERNWLSLKEIELYGLLDEVNIRAFDEALIGYLKLNEELSKCKTLDAIHLATALEFRDKVTVGIGICTYDRNMRRTAGEMNFPVLPHTF